MNGAQWYWLVISIAALAMVFANANAGSLDKLPAEKPTLTIVMPCSMVEKMTFGFPPVAMMTEMFFQRVEFMNSTNMMPVIFNPVCN